MKTVILLILITVLILGFIGTSRFNWEMVNKGGIDTDGLRVLYHLESPYQTIDLARDLKTKHISMFLNGAIQNNTKEYEKSHYAMVDISGKLVKSQPKNILILGGGDGYPAMRALKQPGDPYVKNVEIDDVLIDFVKTNPIMRKHTQDAFNDPKLDLTAMDAYKYIYTEKRRFDVIVYDIARAITNNTVTNFEPCDDHIIENLLASGGVMNYTMDLRAEIPKFGPIFRKYLKLKKKCNKEHLMLLLQTMDDFKKFSKHCPIDIVKLKERYPTSEIGIMMYDLRCSCGNYRYNEELYFYICKEPFNKENEDIKFHSFTSCIP